jgi:hypothetical protein
VRLKPPFGRVPSLANHKNTPGNVSRWLPRSKILSEGEIQASYFFSCSV